MVQRWIAFYTRDLIIPRQWPAGFRDSGSFDKSPLSFNWKLSAGRSVPLRVRRVLTSIRFVNEKEIARVVPIDRGDSEPSLDQVIKIAIQIPPAARTVKAALRTIIALDKSRISIDPQSIESIRDNCRSMKSVLVNDRRLFRNARPVAERKGVIRTNKLFNDDRKRTRGVCEARKIVEFNVERDALMNIDKRQYPPVSVIIRLFVIHLFVSLSLSRIRALRNVTTRGAR